MGYTVLVVDDSETIRGALVKAFGMAKLPMDEIIQAQDGQEAIGVLRERWVDIVLTDINMPIMDGLKLVKRVRTDAVHKDVPIIVITTEGSSEDRQRALQLGANAYITKPIQAPQVIAKVKELLKITP